MGERVPEEEEDFRRKRGVGKGGRMTGGEQG